MKTKNVLREKLGITQKDLAVLLGISRSYLALFELGKRSLPVEAKQKLAALINKSNQNQNFKKTENFAIEPTQKIKMLKELLQNNQRKKYILEKKLKSLEKKLIKEETSQELIQFINEDDDLFKNLKIFPKRNSSKNSSKQDELRNFYLLEIKKELLIIEEKTLKNFLEMF
jgi:transcriptional regulator with XRE-family HTH domain